MDWNNKEEVRKYNREYYKAHKRKIAEQRENYYQKNKEKILENKAEYYQENKEHIIQRQTEYNTKNKEEVYEKRAEYRKTQKGRALNLIGGYRKNDKKANRGECTLTAKWIVEHIFSQPCIYCGETDWTKLGCDRKDNSLPHTPDNVVPCCYSCNCKKRTKNFDEYMFIKKN